MAFQCIMNPLMLAETAHMGDHDFLKHIVSFVSHDIVAFDEFHSPCRRCDHLGQCN